MKISIATETKRGGGDGRGGSVADVVAQEGMQTNRFHINLRIILLLQFSCGDAVGDAPIVARAVPFKPCRHRLYFFIII